MPYPEERIVSVGSIDDMDDDRDAAAIFGKFHPDLTSRA